MATLIIEDGTGIENANSYSTLAFVDEYHLCRGNTDWTSATLQARTEAIIKGTDYLDSHFRYKSTKLTEEQGLKFPRVDYDFIPIEMKKAVALYSSFALRGQLYDSERVEVDGIVRREKIRNKVGEIETETETEFQNGGEIRVIHSNAFDGIAFLINEFIIQEHTRDSSTSGSGSSQYLGAEITGSINSDRG